MNVTFEREEGGKKKREQKRERKRLRESFTNDDNALHYKYRRPPSHQLVVI